MLSFRLERFWIVEVVNLTSAASAALEKGGIMNYGLDALRQDMPKLVKAYLVRGEKPPMSNAEFKLFMNCVELFRTIFTATGLPIEDVEDVDDETIEQMLLF